MEEQSYLFDFKAVDDLLYMWNSTFHTSDMDGVNPNYELVFCTDAPSNIGDCLSGGTLNSNVTVKQAVDCKLLFKDNIISFKGNTVWNIGEEEVTLKAVFLRDKSNGYVMAYNINIDYFYVTNKLMFDDGTILWSISYE